MSNVERERSAGRDPRAGPESGARGEVRGPAIELRGLSKRYPRTWALKAVDLRIETGERVCLLGPNGSGKSTLLRIVSGAARPTRGDVRVFGNAPREDAVRRAIGFLSHQTYLYPELSGLENLRFAAIMYGLAADESTLRGALDSVGLGAAADARVRTYSSGMLKRLALARSTLHSPAVLLLDEPYGALDVQGIEWLERFIDGLAERGRTLVIATHEASRALALVDRAVALAAGRIVYDGPASSYAATAEAGGRP